MVVPVCIIACRCYEIRIVRVPESGKKLSNFDIQIVNLPTDANPTGATGLAATAFILTTYICITGTDGFRVP